MGTTFVDNFEGDFIANGLAHSVFVDIVTKDALSFIYGCACVADASGVGDSFVEIGFE
ncbi:hypothetical protein BMF77_04792 [Dolichospermum sp. UHCC 0315A]|nr:hypothetical protein BMF77_04792 [Dolichospermum sp. UHCC 0315A]